MSSLLPPRLFLLPLLALALLVAACGPLPRPFKPDDQKAVDLRALTYGSTVMVLPLEGAAPADPGPLALALRDALLAEGLLAKTWREAEGALRLSGEAAIRPLGDSRDLLSADWRIDGPEGRLAAYRQERALPAGAWQSGNREALAEVAAEAAQALAPQLLGPAEEEALLPGFPGARLAVLPVTGAPGDGNETLTAALVLVLERAELPVVEARAEGDLAIQGSVAVTPAGAGQERVAIVWRLLDADDSELGKISQENTMTAGTLEGPWGRIAALVARGAADGLTDLLNRLARERAAG
ncbi:MAG: hypothetical protein WD341_12465 [Tistlia sp.]|uniref:hypothetical protein n=1 Tax=Tistlia sp. TaxID=3057121 RepID=UPI0034A1F9F8